MTKQKGCLAFYKPQLDRSRDMGEVKDLQKEREKREKEKAEKEQQSKPKEVPVEEMSKEQIIEKLNETTEEAKKYFDLYLRAQAEIENMKKRFQREREEFIKFANESLIKDLLNVVDNLERAILHAEEGKQTEEAFKALKEGVELTLKGLKDILRKAGLEEFESLGKKFDPNYHHAVEQRDDSSVEPGTVVEELQKGYKLHGKLIRPALVVVSKKEDKKQN